MDINELIKALKKKQYSNWVDFKTLFYEAKIREVFLEPRPGPRTDFYDKVKSTFSADCLNYRDRKLSGISLKHTQFTIGADLMLNIYLDTFPVPYQRQFQFTKIWYVDGNDVVRLMQKIDNSIPEWEDEFKAVCRDNFREIEIFRLRGRDLSYFVTNYLSDIFQLTQLNHKEVRGWRQDVVDALSDEGMLTEKEDDIYIAHCQNFTVEFSNITTFRVLDKIIREPGIFPAEAILEIDRCVPQWIEDARAIQFEFQKQQKIKQIGVNTAVILAKNRMRELGYEYQLNGQLLEIKLQYDRKLAVSLPVNELDRTKRILERLPKHVAAVNSVPGKYQIKNLSEFDMMTVFEAPPEVDRLLKQFGYQYSFDTEFCVANPKSLRLCRFVVSLPKKRELVIEEAQTLQQFATSLLATLPACIDAINSVPSNFRIRKALPCDKWMKEV